MARRKLLTSTLVVVLLFVVDAVEHSKELETLVQFRKSLDDPLLALKNWNTSAHHCQWNGITCSPQGRVVAVHLNSLSLSGPAPFPTIQALTRLRSFSISGNNLTGSLSEIDSSKNCSLEVLDMSSNKLGGMFPGAFMATCSNIKFLNLSSNELSTISSNATMNGSSMVSLDLSYNKIDGTLPLSLFTSCESLRLLDFSHNQLSGEVPKDIIANCDGLEQLSLASNNFTGTFPSSTRSLIKLNISNNFLTGFHIELRVGCMSLEELDVSFNNMSGAMFRKVECAELRMLNLSNNAFSGSFLTVFANQTLGNVLKSLEILDAKQNQFAGEVPSVPPRLQVLDLSSNMLTSVSKSLCSKNSSLKSLVLVYNKLTGAVLNSVMQCKHLEMLDLSINSLNESIPGTFCSNLPKLQHLAMWGNKLEGSIPISLGHCKELLTLDLSHNRLKGFIPEQISELTNISFVLLNNNELSGTIPASLGKLGKLQGIFLSHNHFQGGIPTELGNCSSLLRFEASDNLLTGRIPSWLGRSEPAEGYDNPTPFLIVLVSNNMHPSSCKGYETVYFLQGISLEQFQQMPFMIDYKFRCGSLFAIAPPGYVFLKHISGPLRIDVSYNQLTGSIPEEFGRMADSLYVLMLAGNSLTGELPASLGNLRNLAWLDISSNQLRSMIPDSFSKLTFLQYFNVSHNKLFGVIPGGQVQTFSASSFEGNPGLCGIPLGRCPAPAPVIDHDDEQVDENNNEVEVLVGVVAGIVSTLLWSIAVFRWRGLGQSIEGRFLRRG